MATLLFDALDALDTGIACLTPRDAKRRGCQVSLRVRAGREAGRRLFEKLGQSGVVADWREPDVIRIAPVPLYNTFEEIWTFGEILRSLLNTKI